jgi:phosphoserine aminotransferase
MLAVEDYIFALEWALGVGGLPGLIARSEANAAAVNGWVERTDWVEHLARVPEARSNTSVCLRFAESGDAEAQSALVKKMAGLLEAEGVGYDVASYRDAPPGLRLWCGATVDTDDLEALFPWLDWAFHEARAS